MSGIGGTPGRSAAKIGGQLFVLGYTCGLFIAAGVLILLDGGTLSGLFYVVREWPLQTLICLVVGPVISFLLGRGAGRQISLQRKSPWVLVPVLCFASVWLTVMTFSLVAFFNEGIGSGSFLSVVWDYIFVPLLFITLFGSPFILATGLVVASWFSSSFRSEGGLNK